MNASPAPQSPTAPTAPVFTLGSALRSLGHDCPDRRCSEPIDALTASVWFIRRRGQHFPKYPSETLLVVDLIETGEPLARIHWMIDEVNRCSRGDAIRPASAAARQRTRPDRSHLNLRRRQPVDRPAGYRRNHAPQR